MDQIDYYLEQGRLIHPCYPPDATGCIDPGKTPRWTVERRLKASREERRRAFEGNNDNVGLVPVAPDVILDVDDRSSDKHGMRVFDVRHPRLYGDTLRHPTGDGAHFHLYCEDVPPGQGKIKIRNYLGLVTVEIFVGAGENIIIPPSVHFNGTKYVYGGIQSIKTRWILVPKAFGYDPEKEQEEEKRRRSDGHNGHDGPDWKRVFKGNLLSLDIFALADHFGVLGEERHDTQEGYRCYSCRCPWREEHTKNKTEDWDPRDSSSVLMVKEGSLPQFKCLHSHGDQYRLKEFLYWCQEQEPGIVDAHCSRRWEENWSKGRRKQEEEERVGERGIDEPDGYYPAVDWSATAIDPAAELSWPFPKDSVLEDLYQYCLPLTEGADCYIIGSALPVVARLLARNVYVPFGDATIFPNIFSMVVGPPGDRKSFTIEIANRLLNRLLPREAFLSDVGSPEAMFDEYAACPDNAQIIDDAAHLLGVWKTTQHGESASALFLRLYDCRGLDEAYVRNRKLTADKATRRYIAQTSTTVLYGATPINATFPEQKNQQGLSRRFLFFYSAEPARTIIWPEESSVETLVPLFAPLADFRGPVRLSKEAYNLWEAFQLDNRQRKGAVPEERENERYALASEPVFVLKIAMLFEACRAVKNGQTFLEAIRADTLDCAIKLVSACLSSGQILVGRGRRHETRQQAEEILTGVRHSFARDTVHPDTIYVSRNRLTRKFCHDTSRRGSLQTDTLYLEILPYLGETGQAKQVFKEGRHEIYAFRATDAPHSSANVRVTSANQKDESPRENGATSAKSAKSAPPLPKQPKSEKTGFSSVSETFENTPLYARARACEENENISALPISDCSLNNFENDLFSKSDQNDASVREGAENAENADVAQFSEEKSDSQTADVVRMNEEFVPGQSFETPKFIYCRDPIRAGELIRELNANPSTLISLDLETCKTTAANENTP
jgi:hypothetical protein